jgi:hypothetical protein
MGILSKDIIENWILPSLTSWKRGFSIGVPFRSLLNVFYIEVWKQVVNGENSNQTIFCKWNYFLDWIMVYHFNKWSKAGCWSRFGFFQFWNVTFRFVFYRIRRKLRLLKMEEKPSVIKEEKVVKNKQCFVYIW